VAAAYAIAMSLGLTAFVASELRTRRAAQRDLIIMAEAHGAVG
jgi:hypothetical protein